jgi:3-hydroxybutyryl-CoA dehydrogenase
MDPVGAQIAVIGAGTMGRGITYSYLLAGSSVVLLEVDAQRAQLGRAQVLAMLERAVARGHAHADPAELMDHLTVATDLGAVAGSGLVIEAVPEDLAMKAPVLGAAEGAIAPGAILATNTSSISVSELAATLLRPDRFIGLHFFNPVPASLVVEVVRGAATAADVVDDSVAWVRAIGKEPLVVRDSPGFASSRLGVLIGLEAVRMLEQGVASAEDIDKAMTLGYKHPIGPLHLTDLVGIDVRLDIARYLSRTLGDRFAPPQLMEDLVAQGYLGRKSGRGFFIYD